MNRSQAHRRAGGFTVIEVIVVVTIGGLILSGALEAFTGGDSLVNPSRRGVSFRWYPLRRRAQLTVSRSVARVSAT